MSLHGQVSAIINFKISKYTSSYNYLYPWQVKGLLLNWTNDLHLNGAQEQLWLGALSNITNGLYHGIRTHNLRFTIRPTI